MSETVVISGVGVVAPSGIGKDEYWDNLIAGRSFISHDSEMAALGLKSRVLCRINEDYVKQYSSELTDEALDRFVHLGVAAGKMAMLDAGLPSATTDQQRAGIIFSSAIGGTPTVQRTWEMLTNGGKGPIGHKPIGPNFYNSGMFNYPAVLLAQHFGMRGICTSLSTGCTAGLDALGLAYESIATGDADIMLAGASEAPLTSLTYATLDVIGSLSVAQCEPQKSSRPFDARRGGFVIGEGAAVLVLESAKHAKARGARIYAEVKSYFSHSNAFHMTDLPAHGTPMASVLSQTLQLAAVEPKDIDYINAHGSSTPQNDVFETNAFKAVLGPHAYRIPISSTKSMIGHSLSSASLMGVISVLGAMERGMVHPTANYEYPDPECDLDYVPNTARPVDVKTALVTASGFGGIHSAAVFGRHGAAHVG